MAEARRRGLPAVRRRGLVALAVAALSLTLFTHTPIVHAWNTPAHMVVAAVALRHISKPANQTINFHLGAFREFYPSRSSSMVDASPWMDHVKSSGLRLFDEWHYINIPTIEEGYSPPGGYGEGSPNVVTALTEAVLSLTGAGGGGDVRYSRPDEWTKAFLTRLLVHLMADLHQPLHCTQYFNEQFPGGDGGGTKVFLSPKVDVGSGVSVGDLHAFWDGAAGMLEDVQVAEPPAHTTKEASDVALAAELIDADTLALPNRYELGICDEEGCPLIRVPTVNGGEPAPPAQVRIFWEGKFRGWAEEARSIARDVAYSSEVSRVLEGGGGGAGAAVDTGAAEWEAYASKAKNRARIQLGVAGHRLAALVNSLFLEAPPAPKPPPSPPRHMPSPPPMAPPEAVPCVGSPQATVIGLSVCLAIATAVAAWMTRLYLRSRQQWWRSTMSTYGAGEFDLPKSNFQPLDEDL